MDHAKFFAGLRARGSGLFGTSLNQAQVDAASNFNQGNGNGAVTDRTMEMDSDLPARVTSVEHQVTSQSQRLAALEDWQRPATYPASCG